MNKLWPFVLIAWAMGSAPVWGQESMPGVPEPPAVIPTEPAMPERESWPVRADFGEGFQLSTNDGRYILRFRVLEQTDFKSFSPGYQEPARSGLYIPRFRIYFEGQLTDPFQYELSLQRSVEGTFDVLDANLNVRFAEEFQVRIGRALVPYSYDWYDHLEQYSITPERGLFPLNYGLSRQAGVTAHGRLFDGRMQYAVGGYAGQLSGLADVNNTRDAVGYLNFKPFLRSGTPALQNLNIGGSAAIGTQAYAATPLPLRNSIQSSENDEAAESASTVFLDFTAGTRAIGTRAQGAIHAAYYFGGLSVESEWSVGQFEYARGHIRSLVPVTGFHVTTGYFITGEEVTGRGPVTPVRPFTARMNTGPGAVELFGRYSQLDISRKVFENGFADPEVWTRSAAITDVGLNWYWNRYIKWTFDWQHSMFRTPVRLAERPERFSRSADLFWLRAQVAY